MRKANKKKRIRRYLDPEITQVNMELDQKFYEEEHKADVDLYNMGDNTPVITEEDTK
jgi:hypothetical protein